MAQEADNIFNVADQLRDARKKQKLSVEAVAKEICVRVCYLDAIENGRYDDLPGKTFANGFVKSYAKMVKLDQSKLSKQFIFEYSDYFAKQQTGQDPTINDDADRVCRDGKPGIGQQSASYHNIQMVAPKTRRWPAWMSPVVGLVGAGMSWFLVGTSYTISSVAAIDPIVEERTLAEFAGAIAAQQNGSVVDELVSDAVHVDAEAADADAELTAQVFAATSMFLPAAHASNHVPDGASTSAITFEAVEDSWIQLSYRDGTEMWSGILRAGQSYRPQLIGEVFLTTSNAGGIILKQSNASLSPLGERGGVIEAMPLDASIFEAESFSDAAFSSSAIGGSD